MRTAPPPDVFSGWLELVETPARCALHRRNWRLPWPSGANAIRASGHTGLPQCIAGRDQATLPADGQIAVLLPLSGALAEAGMAVRDGLLTAHFQNSRRHAPAVALLRYRFGCRARLESLSTRVSEGAQQVIGPLSKEAVVALAAAGELSVPVLALNNLPDDKPAPAQLYQFALAPEDEAEQVATRAWEDGQRRALVLIPENALGQRLQQAFVRHWQALGGTLLDVRSYGTDRTVTLTSCVACSSSMPVNNAFRI